MAWPSGPSPTHSLVLGFTGFASFPLQFLILPCINLQAAHAPSQLELICFHFFPCFMGLLFCGVGDRTMSSVLHTLSSTEPNLALLFINLFHFQFAPELFPLCTCFSLLRHSHSLCCLCLCPPPGLPPSMGT